MLIITGPPLLRRLSVQLRSLQYFLYQGLARAIYLQVVLERQFLDNLAVLVRCVATHIFFPSILDYGSFTELRNNVVQVIVTPLNQRIGALF